MQRACKILAGCILLCASHWPAVLLGDARYWTGSAASTGDWFDVNNWDGALTCPAAGDSVTISAGFVLLTNETPELASFAITNATLICSNWPTAIRATTVEILSNAVLTHALCATNVLGLTSNRVSIRCANLDLKAGGKIDVAGAGFVGNGVTNPSGAGSCCGGGYGGFGGRRSGYSPAGISYGAWDSPIGPGSGGGPQGGSPGGGSVLIDATTGTVRVDGLIDANGASDGTYGGGGSGGAIFINCQVLAGTGGTLRANGGNSMYGGPGGGGRIAVVYDTGAQQAAIPKPDVLFSVRSGTYISAVTGALGTLYFPDDQMLRSLLTLSGCLFFDTATNWAPESLTVSNSSVVFPPNFALRVTNDLAVIAAGQLNLTRGTGPAGRLDVGGNVTLVDTGQLHYSFAPGCPATFAIGSNLSLTNGSALYLYAGATNVAPTNYGGLLNLKTRDLVIPTNCAIYLSSDPTNGGSMKILASNLVVAAGGAIDAVGKGYWGMGYPNPSGAGSCCGGGYGGTGGQRGGYSPAGKIYGSTNAPTDPGSGGGYDGGGIGGGLVWIVADGGIVVDGLIDANGRAGAADSGGGIFMAGQTFTGGGIIRANGTQSGWSGGGGGRISIPIGFSDSQIGDLVAGNYIPGLMIYTNEPTFTGTFSATNGVVASAVLATPGTKRFMKILAPEQRQLIITGDPALYGQPGTNGYGDNWVFDVGTVITNAVASPLTATNGMRWTCFGWRATETVGGALITNGATTQAVFIVSTNLTLTWLWTNQYLLTVAAGPNGTVNSNEVNNWYTNGAVVTGILATVDNPLTHYFSAWGGEVPPGSETNNPLTVAMDRARTNVMAVFPSTDGLVKTWNGVDNWTASGNWEPPGAPGIYDTAILQSGTATLSVATSVGDLVVSNGATLVFTNWGTAITVVNDVTIRSNGAITHVACNTNLSGMATNRVYIKCANLTVEIGGKIDVAAKGYPGGYGPGAPNTTDGSGAGYGGNGGRRSAGGHVAGVAYGSSNAPLDPGSGGGTYGGGAIVIEATNGTVRVDGLITANGANGGGGGGAGGGIYIMCRELAGSGGIIRSIGGKGGYAGSGGGRIAVIYDVAAQQAASPKPDIEFSVRGNTNENAIASENGDLGSLYFPDTQLLKPFLRMSGDLFFEPAATNWNPEYLAVSSNYVVFPPNFALKVTNDLTVGSTGRLTVVNVTGSAGRLAVGGNVTLNAGKLYYTFAGGYPETFSIGAGLVLTNNSALYLYAGPTNGGVSYGGLLNLNGRDLLVPANCAIYPYSNPTNGGSIRMIMDNLVVAKNGSINADGLGFAAFYGPGKFPNPDSSGAGYGGKGGTRQGYPPGGPAYGSSNAPVDPGSGASSAGGGAVLIEAVQNIMVDGTITANGIGANGSGSGGGIYIVCAGGFGGGTGGVLRANGGGNGGVYERTGGGGGRIAVWIAVPPGARQSYLAGTPGKVIVSVTPPTNTYAGALCYSGTCSAVNGTNADAGALGEPGTILFFTWPRNPGSMVWVR